jgi:signal transduction histidine kinase
MKRGSSGSSATERGRPARLACALLGATLLAGCALRGAGPTTEYRAAQFAEVEVGRLPEAERRRLDRFTVDSIPDPPDVASLRWRTVPLPRRVDWGPSAPGGGRRPVIHWLRIVHVRGDAAPPLAVYVPRFQPGIGQVDFYVNGTRIDVPATRASNHWNQPLLFRVPASAERAPSFELLIAVLYDSRTTYALAPVQVGNWYVLQWRAALRAFLQSGLPETLSYAFLALGLFAFGFWWRRRRETAYLLFALATVVWCVRTLHYHNATVWMDSRLYWWLTVNSLTWLMVLVYQFALRFQGRRAPAVEWGLWTLVAAAGLYNLPGVAKEPSLAATLTYVAQVLVSLGVTALITREARRTRAPESIVLSGALWICIAFGVYPLPYAAVLLFGSFLYAVLRRYAGAIEDVERVNASLEDRLAARTRELQASHEKLRAVEREQTLAGERQRLMRDMHDGLGSSLMSSLVLVEQGRLAPEQVATVLRECIDDLKLTIDSLEPLGADLVTLLATLRYRLGHRLEGAGLRLDWRVSDLPPLPWLDALAALEVLRILQETLTNVIKHANARSVTISTAADGNDVIVRIVDDGRGYDVAQVQRDSSGRGLPNLQRRAAKLGGEVRIRSGPEGTAVELRLKIERRDGRRHDEAVADERRATSSEGR